MEAAFLVAAGDAATDEVSAPGNYGFVDGSLTGDGVGINGGVGYQGHVLFYVSVPNVEDALENAEKLGGKRLMGPAGTPGVLVVGGSPIRKGM
ncbi:hypothetical protein [Nonomuraea maritima]|uniref:hypothetical protein n=1 Tax=Nonomuraea maritima TaxID=683260 RepID=UPI003720C0C2